MGFFYNEEAKALKRAPSKPRGPIPIASLNALGCSVCPRDKDTKLRTPKMAPDGASSPVLYVLLPAPSLTDDDKGGWARDKVGRALLKQLPRDSDDWTRFGGVIQCGSDTSVIPEHETECCRQRVLDDIEATKPLVILGVGDAPLGWATELPDRFAPKYRGQFMPVKIGSHTCWYYCVSYPNWVFKESKYPSDHELVFNHDMQRLSALLETDRLPDKPVVYDKDHDAGIVQVHGGGYEELLTLERLLAELAREARSGLDLETNGLRPWKLRDPMILTAAVGTFEKTVAFPLDMPDTWHTDRHKRRAWELFIEYLLDSGIKECHNLSFELEWLSYFIDPRITRLTMWDDTMAMARALEVGFGGTKSLEVQTVLTFGFNLKRLSNIDLSQPQWWTRYPLKDILRYNGMDTKWTNMLSRKHRRRLADEPTLSYAHERAVRLASTLVITEYQGLPVDATYAASAEARLQSESSAISKKLQACREVVQYTKKFGRFEPTNPDHVLRLMDKVCGRDEIRRTDPKTGVVKMTTDEEALLEIPAAEVPSAPLILEHRGVEKLLSTYVLPVTSGKIMSQDGMIHAKYSSMQALTWRLAAEDPNAQNWPKRKHKEIRGIVRSRLRRWLLACDYGQIEFRVAGMASEDDNLVKYCWTGYDVHSYWAQRMVQRYGAIKDWVVEEFGVDWDEAGMKTLRQEAKNKWVFPSIFGAAVKSRAASLHLPMDVAQDLDAEFWDELPGVKKWQNRLIKSYQKNLYVETLGGLRRYGPMTPNEIINMPIQGTAAEIVTEAMMALSEMALIEERLDDLHPILNVHDDLTSEPYDDNLEEVINITVRELCRHRFPYIIVPLVVEVSLGERWNEIKEIGKYRSDELFNLPNPYKD